eukprot:TRINITY_DN14450_c0_g1_i1.p1 TRINITY_DN14450_c0_g1~~TRINITY_DN14450_c0_g1_i1.p1  ORF type:complete len:715 (-),score=163.16 TRINITY_DN14450_c0_g1_i1:31-2175(-)
MMGRTYFFYLAFFALVYIVATTAASARIRASGDYKAVARTVPRQHVVPLTIFLKQRNLSELSRRFWEVTNPKHDNYAKYLSRDQIADLVSADPLAVKEVFAWLVAGGVDSAQISVHSNRDAIKAFVPVEVAEQLFDVKMSSYVHKITARPLVRSSVKEELPEHISRHVALITGIADFPPDMRARKMRHTSVVREDNASTAPVILVPRGGDNSISVSFNPICQDGSSATTVPPCINVPPAVVSASLSAVSLNNNTAAVSAAPITCAMEGNQAVCSVTLKGVENYQPVTSIGLTVQYASGASSDSAFTKYWVVPSPMVTVRDLQALYGVPTDARVVDPSVTQSVGEFEQQYYDDADLQLFFQEMGIRNEAPVTVIGPNDQTNPGVEAMLDIEYIMGLAPGAPTTFWSIKANGTEEVDDILTWALQVEDLEIPPLVHSLSYGMSEGNVDKYLGQGYLARSDIEFMKLALRGITVIIACGDTGAGDLGGPPMGYNDCTTLHPDWPSQSPYVTAVGSTYITPLAQPLCYLPAEEGGIDCENEPLGEVSTSVDMGMRWTTGGGFSNVTPRPSYQDDAVLSYFNGSTTFPPAGVYNANGRAYPDVATVGHNLMVSSGGKFFPVDGTSASAPIFAGLLTLINAARFDYNKPPIGFINPALYMLAREAPEVFNDVIVGRNYCGAYGSQPVCCPFGFEAAPGFDAVSGLGSPNFRLLMEAFVAL